jgi:uncharacterized protein YaaW (UPF0174 family)
MQKRLDNFYVFLTIMILIVFVFVAMLIFQESTLRKQKVTYTKVPTKIITNNITKNKENISQSLNNNLSKTYLVIEYEVDEMFVGVFKNIDLFLDFHYSVLGEYEALATMVFADINEMIEAKLFGEDFSKEFMTHDDVILKEYEQNLKNHLQYLHNVAISNVNLKINKKPLQNLKANLTKEISQEIQRLHLLSKNVSIKVPKTISSEISTHSLAKSATKSGVKMAVNSVTSTTGATLGLLCGPFAWICSPVAAGILLVSTDAAVVTSDEFLTREAFKGEIKGVLELNKQRFKDSYFTVYEKSIRRLSKKITQEYKNLPIKEKSVVY